MMKKSQNNLSILMAKCAADFAANYQASNVFEVHVQCTYLITLIKWINLPFSVRFPQFFQDRKNPTEDERRENAIDEESEDLF